MPGFIGPMVAALVLALVSLVPAQAAQKQHGQTQVVTFNANTTPAERRALAEKAGAVVVRELPFVDGLEIEFHGMAPMQAVRLKAEPSVESLEPNAYHKWIQAGPAVQAPLPPVAAALRSEAPVPALGEGVQVAAESPSAGKAPWGVQRVHAPQVWSRATGAGVKVAVIDTGVDGTHLDLAANYAGGYNAVEPGAEQKDDHGHGTHVAGTIAGSGNEGKGALGVAPRARLYSIKVLNAEGGGTNAVIVDGIAWAVNNGMKVINMSLGGPSSAVLKKPSSAPTPRASSSSPPRATTQAPVSAPASYPGDPSQSARRPRRTAWRSSRPRAPRWTSSRRATRSSPPGRAASTRSSRAPRWPRRTWPAWPWRSRWGAATPAKVRAL